MANENDILTKIQSFLQQSVLVPMTKLEKGMDDLRRDMRVDGERLIRIETTIENYQNSVLPAFSKKVEVLNSNVNELSHRVTALEHGKADDKEVTGMRVLLAKHGATLFLLLLVVLNYVQDFLSNAKSP